jgi:hypothetical protein
LLPEFKLKSPFGNPPVLYEVYSQEKAVKLLKNEKAFLKEVNEKRPELAKRKDYDPIGMLREYLSESAKPGLFRNQYDYFNEEKIGRLESIYPVSLQIMLTEIREEITKGMYTYLDVTNSSPTFLQYVCNKFDIPHKYLKFYNENRDLILKELSELNNLDKEGAKRLVIEIMNGGYSAYRKSKKSKWLTDFYTEMQVILNRIARQFPAFFRESLRYKTEARMLFNVEGTCLNTILSTIENYVLGNIGQFLKEEGLLKKTGALFYDGLMIPKNQRIAKLVPKLEAYLKKEMGLELKFHLK